MGARPFLTLDDQLNKLKGRDLVINDEASAKKILSKENYYNVINGYKMPFLKRDLSGCLSVPESYIPGCEFLELYSLHNLDRDLRMLILGFLLKFETHFKTSCAYNFSEAYRDSYSYLNIANYSCDKADLSRVLKNMAALSGEVNKNTDSRRLKSVYIGHYISNHDSVPLWVLVNTLTMGNMSYFYSAVDDPMKEKIAKDFSIQYKSEYGSPEKIASGEIQEIVKAVNLFRNVCAHEEVLFLFKLKKRIKSGIFLKFFNDPRIDGAVIDRSDLFSLIAILKLVLNKNDYLELLDGLEIIFNKYKEEFKSVSRDDIIQLSGFMPSWKDILIAAM